MKIDYQKTIDGLKEKGLIKDGDKYAVCLFRTENYGNTMVTSNVDYILSANDEEIKLFDLHKKTGEYLGSFVFFKKADVVYTKKIKERRFIWATKGLFGGMTIGIHFIPEDFVHDFVIPKKVAGFEQIKQREELFAFVKEVYNSVYEAQEKAYKASK